MLGVKSKSVVITYCAKVVRSHKVYMQLFLMERQLRLQEVMLNFPNVCLLRNMQSYLKRNLQTPSVERVSKQEMPIKFLKVRFVSK